MQTQTAGPDYVALIIEWDDSEEPTLVVQRKPPTRIGLGHRILRTLGDLMAVLRSLRA